MAKLHASSDGLCTTSSDCTADILQNISSNQISTDKSSNIDDCEKGIKTQNQGDSGSPNQLDLKAVTAPGDAVAVAEQQERRRRLRTRRELTERWLDGQTSFRETLLPLSRKESSISGFVTTQPAQ